MKHLIETDGKPSGTKFWFSLCAAIVLTKYAIADISIGALSTGSFDAAGASMLLAVFGATYVTRRNVKIGNGGS